MVYEILYFGVNMTVHTQHKIMIVGIATKVTVTLPT